MENKKRTRRIGPGDIALLKFFRGNFQLTPEMLSDQSGRSVQVVRRRLEVLRREGLLSTRPVPDLFNSPRVHFATFRGWELMHGQGWTIPPADFNLATLPSRKTPINVQIKSNKDFRHDLIIGSLCGRMRAQFTGDWKLKTWERLPAYVGVRSFDKTLIPDAFFRYESPEIEDGCIFLEVENSNANSRNGVQSVVGKAALYERYYSSGEFERRWSAPNFRVVLLMRTWAIAQHQCRLLREEGGGFNSVRWYITSVEASQNMRGRIFMTPKDYDEGVLYSLDQ